MTFSLQAANLFTCKLRQSQSGKLFQLGAEIRSKAENFTLRKIVIHLTFKAEEHIYLKYAKNSRL